MSKKIPAFLENKANLCRAFSLSGLSASPWRGWGRSIREICKPFGQVPVFFPYSQLNPQNFKVTSFSGFRPPADSWQLWLLLWLLLARKDKKRTRETRFSAASALIVIRKPDPPVQPTLRSTCQQTEGPKEETGTLRKPSHWGGFAERGGIHYEYRGESRKGHALLKWKLKHDALLYPPCLYQHATFMLVTSLGEEGVWEHL